jgi:hypothetical protein
MGGRIILEWIMRNRVGNCGLDLSGTGQEPVMTSREKGNETSGFIYFGEFHN